MSKNFYAIIATVVLAASTAQASHHDGREGWITKKNLIAFGAGAATGVGIAALYFLKIAKK